MQSASPINSRPLWLTVSRYPEFGETRDCRLMDHGTCETSVNDSICRINQHDIVSEEANKLTQTTLQNLDQIHD